MCLRAEPKLPYSFPTSKVEISRMGAKRGRKPGCPNDPTDVQKVHALQDTIKVDHPGGPGKFELPKWDPVSQRKRYVML